MVAGMGDVAAIAIALAAFGLFAVALWAIAKL
jgi:hypothetical protein